MHIQTLEPLKHSLVILIEIYLVLYFNVLA